MRFIILRVLATASLTACASATPPSISAADITSAEAEEARISALPVATVEQLPSTQASYTGKLGGDVTIDGDAGYAILGDVTAEVDFAGAAAITGTVDNINLIEDGTPTQLLGGELAISGTTSTTTFTATASGELDAVGEDLPFRGSADVALSLGGDVRADTTATGTTTALIGTWSGGTTSGDFEVQGSGEFFATSD